METGKFRKRRASFTQVSNAALRDNKLSLKAKGLYALISSYLSLENWDLYKSFLMKQCIEGERAFDSAWKEIKESGYLIQYKIKGEGGKWIYEYELLDEKPHPQNAGVENADVENAGVQNVGVNTNTDLTNTDLTNTNSTTQSLSSDERGYKCFNGNENYIEDNTHLKLSKNMKIEVIHWDGERLYKAIDIFKEQKGKYFSLLKKIYSDDGNFAPKNDTNAIDPMKFNNFEAREYDYDDLETKLLGWDKE